MVTLWAKGEESMTEPKKKIPWLFSAEWFSLAAIMIGCCFFIYKELRQDIKEQAARSDRLYEMFIDLLKEQRK